jgi:hypothetical protein
VGSHQLFSTFLDHFIPAERSDLTSGDRMVGRVSLFRCLPGRIRLGPGNPHVHHCIIRHHFPSSVTSTPSRLGEVSDRFNDRFPVRFDLDQWSMRGSKSWRATLSADSIASLEHPFMEPKCNNEIAKFLKRGTMYQ